MPGALPAPDWSRRVLDAHEEGFAAVGGAIVPLGTRLVRRRAARFLEPWSRAGRNPHFEHPLLLPSLLDGIPPDEHEGLPAYRPDGRNTWIYDGRIGIRLRLPRGRPRA